MDTPKELVRKDIDRLEKLLNKDNEENIKEITTKE